MTRWTISAICLLAVFALSACGGGGNQAANNAPANNAPAPAANATPEANKPAPPPKDPNKWREVTATRSDGWHLMGKPGRVELERKGLLKKAPAGVNVIDSLGMASIKVPGPTEPDEEWDKWDATTSGAVVYHVGDKADALETLKSQGGKFVDGFDAGSAAMQGDVAVAKAAGGKYVLAAVSNDNGSYLMVGVIVDEANREQHAKDILKWAGSLKTK